MRNNLKPDFFFYGYWLNFGKLMIADKEKEMNEQIIKILHDLALLLEIKGENPFKSRAYSNAADIIKNQNIDIENAVRQGTLAEIKGFGKALQEKITDYVLNGEMKYFEKIKEEIPIGLLKVIKLPGIGPKKAGMLFREYGVRGIEDLDNMCKNGELAKVKGFNTKSQEIIFIGIGHIKANIGRFSQESIKQDIEKILKTLSDIPGMSNTSLTSDFRRFVETIREIRLVASADSDVSKELKRAFMALQKNNYFYFETENNIPVQIEICSHNNFFWRLHQSTGNDDYLLSFNKLFSDNGYDIGENELKKDGTTIALKNEEELYKLAGIQFVEPELREDPEIIELAKENKLQELICENDLKGMVHCHSTWSDGANTILEMALKSKELGFKYFIICDHSQSAVYANGLSPEKVRLQHEEIDRLNAQDHGIVILKGIESDILPDGSLDYDESTLELFDVVVASVHSHFKMDKEKMTQRIITALQNPYTTMLGHPTGRLLLSREAYPVDMEKVIEAAAEYSKIIEINSNPYRLDLNWQNTRYAKKLGVKISINPDSHRISTLSDVFTGVKVARKGMLSCDDVVNTLKVDDFLKLVRRH